MYILKKKVGIAGTGAIGSAIARALVKGIDGLTLHALSDITPNTEFKVPYVSFKELAEQCDLVIECLPPSIVPELVQEVLSKDKELILVSSSALLIHRSIRDHSKSSKGRIIVPSGALAGIDGVRALSQMGIKSARIATTKKPSGFAGAPYIVENKIDLSTIVDKKKIFTGNAYDAARGFPANVNVAATLSLAGIGPEKTEVEIWADPAAKGNCHEIEVIGEFSTIRASIENKPDPKNPKSSMLAAQSVVALLRSLQEPLVTL